MAVPIKHQYPTLVDSFCYFEIRSGTRREGGGHGGPIAMWWRRLPLALCTSAAADDERCWWMVHQTSRIKDDVIQQ